MFTSTRSPALRTLAASILALLAAVAPASAEECDGIAIFTAPSYTVADAPTCVALADLNGDGLADMVVGSGAFGAGPDLLSIHLNDGHNRFLSATTVALTNPLQIVAGDIDADGDLDLAVATRGIHINVLRNRGDGTFDAPAPYMMGTRAESVVLTDVDADGDLDMAATVSDAQTVVVRRNNGAGHFGAVSARASYTVNGFNPRRIGAADLNGDTFPELVALVAGSDTVAVLFNNTDGTFADPIAYATGVDPVDLALADLDADGHADIVVANDGAAQAFINDGSGGLAAPVSSSLGFIDAQCIALSDLNGDARPDLVAAGFYSDGVRLFMNAGGGDFGPSSYYRAGENQFDIAIGDVDADGDLDVATANHDTDDASVLLNDGDATFTSQEDYEAGINPTSAAFGDLDADGDLDLACVAHGSGTAHVLLNTGDGTYAPATTYPVGDTPRSLVLADLDADADLDMVIASFGSGNVGVLLNNGSGGFADPIDYAVGWNPFRVIVGDFDADGDNDAASVNYGSDNISILLNDGAGALSAPIDYAIGHHPASFAMGDFDLDGDQDLVFTAENSVGTLTNDGSGVFTLGATLDAGIGYAGTINAADLDGDADLDLVFTRYNTTGTAHMLINTGKGAFAPATPLALDFVPGPFTLADVDITLANDLRGVRILLNNGLATFNPEPLH